MSLMASHITIQIPKKSERYTNLNSNPNPIHCNMLVMYKQMVELLQASAKKKQQ